MASLRTLADVAAEYAAARTAYLSALEMQSFSQNDGEGGHSGTRQNVDVLLAQLRSLEAEHARLSRGGIRVRGMTPIP